MERPGAQPTGISAAHVLHGVATYYGTGGPGMYAAMAGYIDGTHVQVEVCAFPAGQATCVTVPVVTQCSACRWRAGAVLVDLSIPAFLALGSPLSRGIVAVTVEIL